jgi:hypothetical protein
LPNSQGIVLVLVAAGVWILLCVDRGLLQAHRRYAGLAANLLIEGGVRTFVVIVLVVAHMGVTGYALGVFLGEVLATLHGHWLAGRTWSAEENPEPVDPDLNTAGPVVSGTAPSTGAAPSTRADATRDAGGSDDGRPAQRRLMADVSAAFVGLALLGLLQNVDVILLGRLDHANVGPYAAISVASKALVFGALALGAYLLPEATIRWNEGGHAIRQLGVTLIFLAVPATALLIISVFIPKWFLTLVFSARLRLTGRRHDLPLVLGPGHQLSLRDRITMDRAAAGRRIGSGPGAGGPGPRSVGGHGPGRSHRPRGPGPSHGDRLLRHSSPTPRPALVSRSVAVTGPDGQRGSRTDRRCPGRVGLVPSG